MSAWQDLFSELRRLYGGAADLLLDAQRLLDHAGWRISHGKGRQIGTEQSGSIAKPDLWAPHYISRFFHSESHPLPNGPLLYVACVLSDGGKCDYSLPEGQPVVTAGVLRFGPAGQRHWRYWMAKCWFWTKKTGWPQSEWQEFKSEGFAKRGIELVECISVPLVQISDRASLERLVIEPLLAKADVRRSPEPELDDAA